LLKRFLPILSLVLFSCAPPWDVPDYETIFQRDRIVEWNIYTSSEDWLRLIVDPMSWPCSDGHLGPDCTTNLDCPLTCRCQEGTCITHYVEAEVWVDGKQYSPVGLRLMGTKRRDKRNMRIRFNKFIVDQRFHGVKRINFRNNLDDPSLIREALALELMRRAGVPAPRYSFVWVSVNGDPGGVYTLVQQVDKKLLESYFGEDFGNLYQIERGGNLIYQDDDPAKHENFDRFYELKTNELTADKTDLTALMCVLALGDLQRDLPEILNVDDWLRMLAVNSWLANMDSYPGTADNLYLYNDAAGRFRPIPWDLNQAFGNYHGWSCDLTADELAGLDPFSPTCGGERPLVDRVLEVESFREMYRDHLQDLVDGILHPDEVQALIESLRWRIREKAHQDVLKEYSNEEFDAAFENDVPVGDNPVRVPGLRPFIQERDRVIRENLF
jgi:spore coat protein CotH